MRKRISGIQIAFLMFAVMFLSVPLGNALLRDVGWPAESKEVLQRMLPFAAFALLLLSFPAIRRQASQLLSRPIARDRRLEIAVVATAMILVPFATTGARVAWSWVAAGSAGISTLTINADVELRQALAWSGMVKFLLLGVVVAPFLEELLCRGFLYRAFERDWGWLPAMIATSVLFGIYHPFFLNAFVGSIVFVCVLRRSGSLRACVYVHAFSNLMMWWPLMGQHLFPDPSRPLGELSTWSLHLACLAIAAVGLAIYVWMSRDRREVAATVMLEPHVAVQK